MAVVFDPTWGKARLLDVGMLLARQWLHLNRLPYPDRVFLDREQANRARRKLLLPHWFGSYQRPWEGGWSAIALDLKKCRPATRVPGFSWSYPGFKADLTPLGVFCHETGHHVDYTFDPDGISRLRPWRDVVDSEEDVSGYEPNYCESFAEALRLFITNPDLLRVGRPERWEYLTSGLGLMPLHTHTWRRVLQKAHPKFKAAAENWIRSGVEVSSLPSPQDVLFL